MDLLGWEKSSCRRTHQSKDKTPQFHSMEEGAKIEQPQCGCERGLGEEVQGREEAVGGEG